MAGGTYNEMSEDSLFLNSLNGSCKRYGAGQIFFRATDDIDEEIESAWDKVVIKVQFNGDKVETNRYFLNNQEITQEQARQHAMKFTGHYMTEKDWKF